MKILRGITQFLAVALFLSNPAFAVDTVFLDTALPSINSGFHLGQGVSLSRNSAGERPISRHQTYYEQSVDRAPVYPKLNFFVSIVHEGIDTFALVISARIVRAVETLENLKPVCEAMNTGAPDFVARFGTHYVSKIYFGNYFSETAHYKSKDGSMPEEIFFAFGDSLAEMVHLASFVNNFYGQMKDYRFLYDRAPTSNVKFDRANAPLPVTQLSLLFFSLLKGEIDKRSLDRKLENVIQSGKVMKALGSENPAAQRHVGYFFTEHKNHEAL